MVVGFNHNIRYKGEVFHVQTEDSGRSNPHIITLLYRGGTIICSKKTSYADILKIENLELVVEDLMKEQHKDMLRRLKAGEFDDRAFAQPSAAVPAPAAEKSESPASPPPRPQPAPQAAAPAPPKPAAPKSLDEIILDYLASGDD